MASSTNKIVTIGHYFFQNEVENAVTTKTECYKTMLTDFFPEFDEIAAPPHFSRLNMDTLRVKFYDSLISRNDRQDHAIYASRLFSLEVY